MADMIINLPSIIVPYTPQYVNPNKNGEIPLMAIGTPSGITKFDVDTLSKMRECGMNIAQNTLIESTIGESLENAQNTGMKIMVRLYMKSFSIVKTVNEIKERKKTDNQEVSDNLNLIDPTDPAWDSFYEMWEDVVRLYKNNSAVAGWMIKDEPTVKDFWVIAECTKRILAIVLENVGSTLVFNNLIKEMDSSHLDRLTGGMNDEKVLAHVHGYKPIQSYQDYLWLYRQLNGPSMLSVDTYPFSGETHTFNKNLSVWEKDIYHTNVNLERNIQSFFSTMKVYNDQKFPFWSTVATTREIYKKTDVGDGGKTVTIFEDRLQSPTLATVRYQSFSALAFGACGLSFWRFSDEGKQEADPKWVDSPLGTDGKKNPTFDIVKTVAAQIKKYQKVFLNAKTVTPVLTRPYEKSEVGIDPYSEDYIPRANNTLGLKVLVVGPMGFISDLGVVSNKAGEEVSEIEKKDDRAAEYNDLVGDGGMQEIDDDTKISTITFSFLKRFFSLSDSEYGFLISHILTEKKKYLVVVNLDYNKVQSVYMEFTDYVRDESSSTAIVKQLTVKMQPGDWRIFSRDV